MPLTDTAVRGARVRAKPFKKSDQRGLYMLVNAAGKYWRYDYRFAVKRKTLALEVYPDVSLRKARARRDEARARLSDGIDPGLQKKAARAANVERAANSFETIAREWHAKYTPTWSEVHAVRILRRLEVDVFPWIGGRSIREITAKGLLAVLRRIESREALETAHRAHQNCSQVFRYAVATGRAERDPSADLRGALPPVKQKHHASITDLQAGDRRVTRASGPHRQRQVCFPGRPLEWPANVRKHGQRGAAQARLRFGPDDGPRIPQYGEHTAK